MEQNIMASRTPSITIINTHSAAVQPCS